jgi:hypothetical protein
LYNNNNKVIVRYFVGANENGIKKIYKESDIIDIIELQSLFFNLLYYFPEIDIKDNSQGSYLKINNLDIFKYYPNYSKMLLKRNNFWNKK